MAKPLGPKSLVIRQAITAHPNKGNKEIAEFINDSQDRLDDKISVTPQDIAQQKQAMKKGGEAAAPTAAAKPAPASVSDTPVSAHRGRPKGSGGRPKNAVTAAAAPAPRVAAPSGSPVDLIDKTFTLAQECGGLDQLKRLVDRLAGT